MHSHEPGGIMKYLPRKPSHRHLRVWYPTTRAAPGGEQLFREASRRLQTSVIRMMLAESTPLELQRVFSEIPHERPDAIIVSAVGDLGTYGSANCRADRKKPPAGDLSVPRVRRGRRADGL